MERHGQVIGVKPEFLIEYIKCHKDVWPGVLKMIKECNIRNYTIYNKGNLLFSYFEYVGENFEADMARMGKDEETRRWWGLVGPMQNPVVDRRDGEWWAEMESVFHLD